MLYKNKITDLLKRHSGLRLLCLFFLCFYGYKAQVNLLIDPSFEIYDSCGPGMWLRGSKYWHSLDSTVNGASPTTPCTPVYCNVCSIYPEAELPHNHLLGPESYFYPRTGNGLYVGGFFLANAVGQPYTRVFLRGQFFKKLENGKPYCGKFYVSLYKRCAYAVDRIGAYADDGSLDANSPCLPIIVTPAFENPAGNIITDTMNWVRIQGVFTANGSEKFLTIGNFYSDANTSTIHFNPASGRDDSGYYIDDVSVIATEIKADGGPDQTICIGDSITLGRPQEIGLECQWFVPGNPVPFSNNSDFTFKATQTGTYTFVQRMDNCAITFDTVNITVVQACDTAFTIPNVFTPNEDGNNDTWSFHIPGATNVHFNIYNRWGNLVKTNPDISNLTFVSWDGRTTSGEKCSEGVYYYVLEYTDGTGQAQKKKGFINLFR